VLARIAASVGAMLGHALTVRVSVPATLQLIQVAAGRMEGFWQFSPVLSGLVSGALLVREAGGQVTDLTGTEWGPEAQGLLAAPPQLTGPMVAVLSTKGN
jgi:myo-inositol-1(or 4)-monophosphatase